MNATLPPSKRSRVEREMDWLILAMFALLLVMCIIGAVAYSVWTHHLSPDQWSASHLILQSSPAPPHPQPPPSSAAGLLYAACLVHQSATAESCSNGNCIQALAGRFAVSVQASFILLTTSTTLNEPGDSHEGSFHDGSSKGSWPYLTSLTA